MSLFDDRMRRATPAVQALLVLLREELSAALPDLRQYVTDSNDGDLRLQYGNPPKVIAVISIMLRPPSLRIEVRVDSQRLPKISAGFSECTRHTAGERWISIDLSRGSHLADAIKLLTRTCT